MTLLHFPRCPIPLQFLFPRSTLTNLIHLLMIHSFIFKSFVCTTLSFFFFFFFQKIKQKIIFTLYPYLQHSISHHITSHHSTAQYTSHSPWAFPSHLNLRPPPSTPNPSTRLSRPPSYYAQSTCSSSNLF